MRETGLAILGERYLFHPELPLHPPPVDGPTRADFSSRALLIAEKADVHFHDKLLLTDSIRKAQSGGAHQLRYASGSWFL
jgi:hypothetical protein